MKILYDKVLALGTGKSTLIKNHKKVAAKLGNVTIDEVTLIQRSYVKTMRFMRLCLGGSPK